MQSVEESRKRLNALKAAGALPPNLFDDTAGAEPAVQRSTRAPRASSMMVLMVRAHRPHSALQPRQP